MKKRNGLVQFLIRNGFMSKPLKRTRFDFVSELIAALQISFLSWLTTLNQVEIFFRLDERVSA